MSGPGGAPNSYENRPRPFSQAGEEASVAVEAAARKNQ